MTVATASKHKSVDFILIDTPEPERLYYPFVKHINYARYPGNWSKVSWLIRKMAGFRCVWCNGTNRLRTHHMGVPYVDGKPGNKYDKHDLRLENLYCLCEACEKKADALFSGVKPDRAVYKTDKIYRALDRQLKKQRRLRAQHQALGIGTGLVPYKPKSL